MRLSILSSSFLLALSLLGVDGAQALTAREPARIVRPGQLVRLEVRDAPPGATVRFTLPDRGPSGTFADGSIVIEAAASQSGAAEVSFTVGMALGPLLADASLGPLGEQASFALTVLPDGEVEPAVSAQQARAAIEQLTRIGETVHGPVLIPAGMEVRAAAPPVVFDHNAPYVAAHDQWLAWVDTDPQARFGHLARWVRIDAASGDQTMLYQDWWPELRATGAAEATPLLGASRANRQAPPPSPTDGPGSADSCLAALLGGRLPAAAQDATGLAESLVSSGQVAAANVRFAGSADEAQSALQLAGESGCTELFLLVSAHAGQARGGGILLAPGEYLTYARLAEWLTPFAQVQAALAVSFAEDAATWLDARGIEGTVLPSAFAQTAAPLNAVERLLEAAARPGSDADGDGVVTLAEAHLAAEFSRGAPAPAPITPDGFRRMWLSDVDIADAGGEQRIDVTRPLNIDLGPTLIYNASSDDEETAGIQTKVFVLPSDQGLLRFNFGGRKRGETGYQIATNDSAQQIYAANGRIEIGSFTVEPNGVALRTDSPTAARQQLTIRRHGYWNRRQAPAIFVVSSRDESIVRPVETEVQTDGAMAAIELMATGPGRTFVDIRDLTAKNTATVEVRVLGAPDPACPAEGSAQVAYAVAPGGDPAGVAGRIALQRGMLYWKRIGARIRIWGDKAPIITAEGTIAADCTFSATGDSGQERVAGVIGLGAAYENGRISAAAGTIAFDYTLGELEPGQTVTYSATGPTAVPSGLLSSAVQLVNQTGGEQTIAIGVAAGAAWTAASDSDWIHILSADSGSGPALVRILISPNGTAARRMGVLTLAGEPVSITQEAGPDLGEPLVVAVLNGASFQEGAASAGWLTIAGFGLADETAVWFSEPTGVGQAGGPLPTQLAGVSVAINGRPAYVQFVSPRQINVLAPDDPTVGRVEVTVNNNGRVSSPVMVAKQDIAPELFRFLPREGRYPAAVHPDGSLVGPPGLFRTQSTRPAAPGDVILLFGSGFGATDPPTPTARLVPQPAPLAEPVSASVGGVPTDTLFSGLVGSGLYQFNIVIPDLPPGDHLIELWSDGRTLETTAYVTAE